MTIPQSVVSRTGNSYCLVSPEEMRQAMAPYGVRKCKPSEIVPALKLGESLVGCKLARAEVVYTLDTITGMSIWITGDPISGLYVSVPLTREGRVAAERGEFIPEDPVLSHVAPARTPVHGSYLGVYAGATREARRAIMKASVAVRESHFPEIPSYARAATAEGERAMLEMGFRRLDKTAPGMFVLDPLAGWKR